MIPAFHLVREPNSWGLPRSKLIADQAELKSSCPGYFIAKTCCNCCFIFLLFNLLAKEMEISHHVDLFLDLCYELLQNVAQHYHTDHLEAHQYSRKATYTLASTLENKKTAIIEKTWVFLYYFSLMSCLTEEPFGKSNCKLN